jgi:hypothetical protein
VEWATTSRELFDQRFEAGIANRLDASEGELVTVVGRHCESGDILVDGVSLNAPRVDDLLVVPATGHIATQCPTITTEIDADLLYSLRPKRQVLSCVERRGTILPRVMSHERQIPRRGWRPSGVGSSEKVGGKSWQRLVKNSSTAP